MKADFKTMEIGDKFKHRFIKDMACEIIGFTMKGYKVRQTEGKKSKQAFFESIWFHPEKGVWQKI